MRRHAFKSLVEWKNAPDRKPLLLQGARQTGKTWLMKEFGGREYGQTLYANFDSRRSLNRYFAEDLDTRRIIASLEAEFETKIRPADTLIIFDEVQECPGALGSLKYFNEEAPQYHIIAAGSLLGVATHEGNSFPVGKVARLQLTPLSFYEFLEALGQEQLLEGIYKKDFPLIRSLAGKYEELLKTYFYVGGMPGAVSAFLKRRDLGEVRNIQRDILRDYTADFSRHIKGVNIPKVKMIWDSIPQHLSREKKKFVYRELKQGGRASEFEDAMDWLIRTGLVYRISRSDMPGLPPAGFENSSFFKLYMLDVGLLAAKAELDIKTFFDSKPEVFRAFKGALTEQFVLQELKTQEHLPIYYWGRETGKAEVDFIFQYENEIIPLEVKADTHKRSLSLDVYMKEYAPKRAIRLSLTDYGVKDRLYSIPLYMTGSFPELI
ncbi:MAG: ATP-binding protein [Spirochaetaceae bacterium]|jgi:predicted AAA+ superfamily ATPase|nr:ATP-binding protein [Spirochaetaceae bacterium]